VKCERIADGSLPATGTENETPRSKTARPWNWNEFRQYNVTKTSIAERYELFINLKVKKTIIMFTTTA